MKKPVPVESTSLAAVGYDPREKVLEVVFRSGEVYRYFDVPASTHSALLAAGSKGHFLNTWVRGTFRCERVAKEERKT